jgi:hypothetical protein
MSPKKPTAKAIKATLAKHSPQRLQVIDACAAKGCLNPPDVKAKGIGYCAQHMPLSPKAAKAAKAIKVVALSEEELAEGFEKLIKNPKLTGLARVAGIPPEAKKKATPGAVKLIEKLRTAGWSDAQIGLAVGIQDTGNLPRDTVWKWRKAKAACPCLKELRALVQLPVPQKVMRGSIRAPKAPSQVSARVNAKLDDPRQLRLALEGIRDALTAALK